MKKAKNEKVKRKKTETKLEKKTRQENETS